MRTLCVLEDDRFSATKNNKRQALTNDTVFIETILNYITETAQYQNITERTT